MLIGTGAGGHVEAGRQARRTRRRATALAVALVGSAVAALATASPAAAAPTSYSVNTLVDAPDAQPGDGQCATAQSTCSLRAAVTEAGWSPDKTTIALPAGTFHLGLGHLKVQGWADIDIVGTGTGTVIVPAKYHSAFQVWGGASLGLQHLSVNFASQATAIAVFNADLVLDQVGMHDNTSFHSGSSSMIEAVESEVRIRGLTATNNRTYGNSSIPTGGWGEMTPGANILNRDGSMVIADSRFVNNVTTTTGGAVTSYGELAPTHLIIEGSSFEGNQGLEGGAVHSTTARPEDTTVIPELYVDIIDTTFEDNVGEVAGGAISHNAGFGYPGRLNIEDSYLAGNRAMGPYGPAVGGAIVNRGEALISRTTIRGNGSDTTGGVLHGAPGHMTIERSAIVDNAGAGVRNGASMLIANTTISGNRSDHLSSAITNVAPVFSDQPATLEIVASTIVNNSGGTAAIYSDADSRMRIVSSIVAGHRGQSCDLHPNVVAGVVSGGHNIQDDTTCHLDTATDVFGDPKLSSTITETGPGQHSFQPLATSPAVDAGDATACAAHPVSGMDQIGRARRGVCDIGAREWQPPVRLRPGTIDGGRFALGPI